MRRPARTTMCIWTMLAGATISAAMAQDVPYGVGDWPEALGNHRARIRVEQPADAVWVHLPWRRRDAVPGRIDIIVIDAATNQRIENVLRVNIQRQSGDLLFQPVTVPGEYLVYYLPFKTEGSWYFPTTVYLPPGHTAQPAWVSACQPQVERLRSGNTVDLPAARVVEFQALNAFHRFDPMEVVASGEETSALVAAHSDRPYLLFPEDRQYAIRMTDELPLRWVRSGPSTSFVGEACRGEFYTWQIGLFASAQSVDEIAVEFSDLTPAAGANGGIGSRRGSSLLQSGWHRLARPATEQSRERAAREGPSPLVRRGRATRHRAGDLSGHGDAARPARRHADRLDVEHLRQAARRRR